MAASCSCTAPAVTTGGKRNAAGCRPLPPTWGPAAALTGGLLSSSCCVIQLALNLLGVGCAGFAILEPLKPYARGATVAVMARLLWITGLTRRTVATLVLALVLASSESLVSAYNKGDVRRRLGQALRLSLPGWLLPSMRDRLDSVHSAPRQPQSGGDPTSSASGHDDGRDEDGADDDAALQEVTHTATRLYVFQVPGIKCEGCAMRLKLALLKHPGVVDARVHYQNKTVEVEVAPAAHQEGGAAPAGHEPEAGAAGTEEQQRQQQCAAPGEGAGGECSVGAARSSKSGPSSPAGQDHQQTSGPAGEQEVAAVAQALMHAMRMVDFGYQPVLQWTRVEAKQQERRGSTSSAGQHGDWVEV